MARVYNIDLVDTSKVVSRSFCSPQDGAERNQDEEGVRVCRIVCVHFEIHNRNCELRRFLPGKNNVNRWERGLLMTDWGRDLEDGSSKGNRGMLLN